MAQWLGIRLPRQGTQVQSLVQEDVTRHGATKLMCHNYRAHTLHLLKLEHLEPVLRDERSHCSEKAEHHNEEQPPLATTRERPHIPTKTQSRQKLTDWLKKRNLNKKKGLKKSEKITDQLCYSKKLWDCDSKKKHLYPIHSPHSSYSLASDLVQEAFDGRDHALIIFVFLGCVWVTADGEWVNRWGNASATSLITPRCTWTWHL